MELSEKIAPQLPYLRRFARALTGSQASGDAYVSALLESIIADPPMIAAAENVRIALYSGLCSIWGSVRVNQESHTSSGGTEQVVTERLGRIPGLPRQVYILHAVEGFDFGQIAAILRTDEARVQDLYQQAAVQISAMISSDVLIIEDEPLIALDIEDLVTSLGHRVIAIARTHKEALEMARSSRPQLILSDIQLADGSSGIDAVNDLLKSFNVPVIFITAFPERLLTGERPEPAFLITKPFSPEMVKGVIAQALFFDVTSQKAA
jgi:CheY-like chemotaxis protein